MNDVSGSTFNSPGNAHHGRQSDSSVPFPSDGGTVSDLSLPSPHRLSVQLIGKDSPNHILITAAASSTMRKTSVLHSMLTGKHREISREPVITLSTSTATCPIHLLAITMLFSDGSALAANTVPPNHMRISSFGSSMVWDPAVAAEFDRKQSRTRRSVEKSTGGAATTIPVRINSIIVWPAWVPEPDGGQAEHSIARPLGLMDDVLVSVQSGLNFTDPGRPQDSSMWVVERMRERTVRAACLSHYD